MYVCTSLPQALSPLHCNLTLNVSRLYDLHKSSISPALATDVASQGHRLEVSLGVDTVGIDICDIDLFWLCVYVCVCGGVSLGELVWVKEKIFTRSDNKDCKGCLTKKHTRILSSLP